MSPRLYTAAAALALLIPASTTHAAPRTTERSFPAQTPGTLTVTAKHGGEIRVAGWDKPEVHVLVTDARGNYKVEFVPSGANLEIRGSHDGPKLLKVTTDVVFDIQVPHRFDLSLATDGGEILLQSIEGSIVGRTRGGDLKLVELTGKMDLQTMGGNIDVAHCDASGPLRTSGGNVSIANAGAGADVETMGGNIEIGPVDGPVKVHTMGGSIEIRLGPAAGDCSASTNGGNITLWVPSGYSGLFRARATGVPTNLGVESRVPGLDMLGGAKLGDGTHGVDLSTDGGTIRILPVERESPGDNR